MRNRAGSCAGLTLMEMIVVMVLIMILLSILLPTIKKHQESVDRVKCSSNLHQMHIAYRSWRADHPFVNADQRTLPNNWTGELLDYLNEYEEVLVCPSDEALAQNDRGRGGTVDVDGDGIPDNLEDEDFTDILAPPQGAGNIQIKKNVPKDLRLHKVQNSSVIRMYKERANYELRGGIKVNISETGLRGGGQGKASTKTIKAGTKVDVYLLHYDPREGKKIVRNGRVTFGGEILGLVTQVPTLKQSDGPIGHQKTKYYKGKYRGIEFSDDIITFEEDRMSLTINYFRTPGWMEEMRVLVTPSSYTSYGMNLGLDPRHGKNTILFSDYYKPLFNITGEVDDPYLQAYMDDPSKFPGRHFGRINVLFYGGNVELVDPERFFDPDDDLWGGHQHP